ncbi:MAG: hypothetical protein HC913_02815 [Microscillaceae bacterium]|nr:hypothetical protein [Microscillaceae bacterium]
MPGFDVLAVVIGIVFVYLLLSLLATVVNEWVMMLLNARGRNLRLAIETMLGDLGKNDHLAEAFFAHPLFKKMTIKGKVRPLPSYLNREIFAKILVDILTSGKNYRATFSEIEEKIIQLFPDERSQTRRLFFSFITQTGDSLDRFQREMHEWYDSVMDRASGWYQRRVKKILLALGFGLSVIFNADSFEMVKQLARDPQAQAEILQQASRFLQLAPVGPGVRTAEVPKEDSLYKGRMDTLRREMQTLVKEATQTQALLGMGWSQEKVQILFSSVYTFGISLLGWFLTAIAISFGAPLWFDLLKNLVRMRTSGPVKSKEGGSA